MFTFGKELPISKKVKFQADVAKVMSAKSFYLMVIFTSLLLWGFQSQPVMHAFGVTEKAHDSKISSPLKQLAAGIEPGQIQCKQGKQLALKSSSLKPVCLNKSSVEILLARGWILPPTTQDTRTDGKNETSANQTKPKSYTIELRESMAVGTK